jgi:hypothetical protein
LHCKINTIENSQCEEEKMMRRYNIQLLILLIFCLYILPSFTSSTSLHSLIEQSEEASGGGGEGGGSGDDGIAPSIAECKQLPHRSAQAEFLIHHIKANRSIAGKTKKGGRREIVIGL